MQFEQFPLELVSNFISLVVVIAVFYRFYQYKQKLDVIKGLGELHEQNRLTSEDKEFIKTNFQEYSFKLQKQEALIKFVYPLFIMIAAGLLLIFSFSEAMIHLNVIVVIFIYLHIIRIHQKNFVSFLKELQE